MSDHHYHYGAIPDTPDFRDLVKEYHPSLIPSKEDYPQVDLRKYVTRVYDQKSLSSCTANALCSAYGVHLEKLSQTYDPSRLFLHFKTLKSEQTEQSKVPVGIFERVYYSISGFFKSHGHIDDRASSLRDAMKALKDHGLCEEKGWPYDVKKFSKEPTAKGKSFVLKYERLRQNIDQFRACLKEEFPFVFVFNVYKSFHDNAKEPGHMTEPTYHETAPELKPKGMQAVMAVGYDDEKQHVIVLNSWGGDWGDKGYFYMPYEFIKDFKMCFDFWKISFTDEVSPVSSNVTNQDPLPVPGANGEAAVRRPLGDAGAGGLG